LRVEVLSNAKIANTPVDRDTANWLAGIGTDLADKLAAVGLIAARSSRLLGEVRRGIHRGTRRREGIDSYLAACRREPSDFLRGGGCASPVPRRPGTPARASAGYRCSRSCASTSRKRLIRRTKAKCTLCVIRVYGSERRTSICGKG